MKNLISEWKNIKRENYNCISLNNFLAYNFSNYHIENILIPVIIQGEKVQFTNVCFNSNGTGYDYFLVLVGNKYKFLNYGYEAYCDGGYYFAHFIELFDVTDKTHYTQTKNIYPNDICKILINL